MQATLSLTFKRDVAQAFVQFLTQDAPHPSCLMIELRRSYVGHPLFHSLLRYAGPCNAALAKPKEAFIRLLSQQCPYLADLFATPSVVIPELGSVRLDAFISSIRIDHHVLVLDLLNGPRGMQYLVYLATLVDPDVEIDYLYVYQQHVHTSSQPLWICDDTIYHEEELYRVLSTRYRAYCRETGLTPETMPSLMDMASCLPDCMIYKPRHLPWSDPYHDTID